MRSFISKHIDLLQMIALALVPLTMVVCLFTNTEFAALLTTSVVVLSFVPFILGLEQANLKPRHLMPIVVMAALGVAGRILFLPIPSVQPVSAIVIITGAIFGKRSGFLTGMLAALISNIFLGQGPWTLWQMYSWGLMGYIAGVLSRHGILAGRNSVLVFSAIAPFFYGLIVDSYYVVGFVTERTIQAVLLAYSLGLMSSIAHSVSTVGYTALIYLPWVRKLERIKRKYGINDGSVREPEAQSTSPDS